jgi:hypothetical protein
MLLALIITAIAIIRSVIGLKNIDGACRSGDNPTSRLLWRVRWALLRATQSADLRLTYEIEYADKNDQAT